MENNIKLKQIIIIGFQSKNRKLEVNFSKRNTSIIFGENGSGKTTFLRVINAILTQNSSVLYSLNIQSIEIKFIINNQENIVKIQSSNSKNINKIYLADTININEVEEEFSKNIKKDKQGFYIEDNENGENFEYDWSEYNNSELVETTSLSLGVERGITQRTLNIHGEDIYHYFRTNYRYRRDLKGINIRHLSEELAHFLKRTKSRRRHSRERGLSLDNNHVFLQNIEIDNIEELLLEIYIKAKNIATERIQNALFDTLSFIFDKKTTENQKSDINIKDDVEFIDSLFSTKGRIIEALDEDDDNNKFKNQMIKRLKDINTKEDIVRAVDNSILYDLIKNMMNELEVEKSLLNSINIFIEQYNKFLGDDKQLLITEGSIDINIDNESHSINVLSSGERHIFTFLALIIIEGRDRNFIFIDEPEISLNIKWQRVLMELLEELAPNTQIIVASHSAFLSSKMPDALVELASERI